MILIQPHVLCDHCGEELRFIEGTSVLLSELNEMAALHECHKGSWLEDTVKALPEYRLAQLLPHPRMYRIKDPDTSPVMALVETTTYQDDQLPFGD